MLTPLINNENIVKSLREHSSTSFKSQSEESVFNRNSFDGVGGEQTL